MLRGRLEELEQIERPSASEGECRAAEWIVERFAELGAAARIEAEPAHGTYWWPLGIGAALGALGGIAALRGRRLLGAVLGAIGAAGIVDDFPPGKRRLRMPLRKRTTYNVVCELGPADAKRTMVVVAHHDAAHSGLIFHPAPPKIADRLGLIEGTGVIALLALARRLVEEPPRDLRVILLSAGAEESFSEGIKAFGERHFGELPRESTFFLAVDSIGSPHLLVLRGEGFLKMREYPARALALMDGLAEELGIWLYPNLRLHNGTDGLEPLAAGYETASLCGCNELKNPANYHWPNDLASNVDFNSVADGTRLIEATVRRLDTRWLD
jgi:hypothetical protein